MPNALTLGPLFVPLERLLFVIAMLVTLLVGFGLERYYRKEDTVGFWVMLLSGFGVGRLVHAIEYWPVYRRSPVDLLYVWQGGFNWLAGVLAALLAGWLWSRRKQLPMTLKAGPVIAGTLVWLGGALLIQSSETTPEPLPELRVSDMDGRPVLLTDLAGEPTVINLWASWCPPCRREMPTFERAQDAWPGIHFVYLNQGEDAATARAYLAEHDRRLETVLLDGPSLLSRHFEARGLPTTLFFDASGRLQAMHPGEISATQLERYLEAL